MQRLTRWKSMQSRVFDIVFGVLPALFFGFWAGFGAVATTAAKNNTDGIGVLTFFATCILGLSACLSMIYVSLARENTHSRKLHIVLLTLGIVVTIIFFVFPSPLAYFSQLSRVFPILSIALVLVATKHIYLLSRATQKVSL